MAIGTRSKQATSRSSRVRRDPKRPTQGELPFRQRGGARKGAGRKPKGQAAMVARTTRAAHAAYHPALVTVKLRQHIPRLRSRSIFY